MSIKISILLKKKFKTSELIIFKKKIVYSFEVNRK